MASRRKPQGFSKPVPAFNVVGPKSPDLIGASGAQIRPSTL